MKWHQIAVVFLFSAHVSGNETSNTELANRKRPRPDEIEQTESPTKKMKLSDITLILNDNEEIPLDEKTLKLLNLSNVIKNQLEIGDQTGLITIPLSKTEFGTLVYWLQLAEQNRMEVKNKLARQGIASLNGLLRLSDYLDIPTLYEDIMAALYKKITNSTPTTIEKFVEFPVQTMNAYDQLPAPIQDALARKITRHLAPYAVEELRPVSINPYVQDEYFFQSDDTLTMFAYYTPEVRIKLYNRISDSGKIINDVRIFQSKFSHDRATFFSFDGKSDFIRVYDASTGDYKEEISSGLVINAFIIDPTDRYVIYAHSKKLYFHDITTGSITLEIDTGIENPIQAFCFCKNNTALAMLDNSGKITIVDRAAGNIIGQLSLDAKNIKNGAIWGLTCNADSSLITATINNNTYLFSLNTNTLERTIFHDDSLYTPTFVDEFLIYVINKGSLMLLNTKTWQESRIHDRPGVDKFRVSSDGKMIALGDSHKITVYDLGQTIKSYRAIDEIDFQGALLINAIALTYQRGTRFELNKKNQPVWHIYSALPDATKKRLKKYITLTDEYIFKPIYQ